MAKVSFLSSILGYHSRNHHQHSAIMQFTFLLKYESDNEVDLVVSEMK